MEVSLSKKIDFDNIQKANYSQLLKMEKKTIFTIKKR